MSLNDYQEQILDNYKNPQNFGIPDWKPSTLYKNKNISCGDEIEVYLLVENNILKDIQFTGRGCSISIATASLLSQEFKGKSINLIEKFTAENLKELLGIPLTSSRLVCATLSLEAIKNSIENLKNSNLE